MIVKIKRQNDDNSPAIFVDPCNIAVNAAPFRGRQSCDVLSAVADKSFADGFRRPIFARFVPTNRPADPLRAR